MIIGVHLLTAQTLVRAEALLNNLIDTPTADVVDHYGYNVSFRFYSRGGLITKTAFGVFPRLNIGFALDSEKFIGQETVDLNRPTLNVKFRFFDGKRNLPALAAGFDGQGYFFDKGTDEYRQREKGLYIVGSGEIFIPHLSLHGGWNVYDFSEDELYGFVGVHYLYAGILGFTYEVDNVRVAQNNRQNIGVRYLVTPSLSVEVAGRDIWSKRKEERVIRISYFGGF